MRPENWPLLLAQFVDNRRNDPFEWGRRDCVALANDWVEVLTGKKVFSGKHKTQKQAAARIAKYGSLGAAVTTHVGEPLAEPLRAMRGDLVLFDGPLGDTIGICLGATLVAQDQEGLRTLPIMLITAAWAV